ncbi:MAG: rhodanese-related sulfurtransferase [Fimbriimonadaceae bacterium]|nr:rhodanese-related sulfurtransferase [Fimbriimonadaceae bacterium]
MDYDILLFYKFAPVAEPGRLQAELLQFGQSRGLRGRVIVASEGINGTISGPRADCDAVREWLARWPEFSDIVYKVDAAEAHAFTRWSVKLRSEIVTLGDDVRPWEQTGTHLSPPEFRERLERGDALILDIRNDYEYEAGHFEGAIRPPVQSFREFPEWLAGVLAEAGERPILTYCTGGIRCEKLTAWLVREGVRNVYQLEGGIVEYGKHPETRGAHWRGQCYVFDERVVVPVGDAPTELARCLHCGAPTDQWLNCAHVDCNRQFACCPACEVTWTESCSEACRAAPRRRMRRGRLQPELRSPAVALRRRRSRARRKAKARG